MLLLLSLELRQIVVQTVETLLPCHTIFLNPVSNFLKRGRFDAARTPLGGSASGDKPSVLKNFDVLGDSGECHLKRLGKLRNRRFAGHQVRQDGPPSGIGKGGEGNCELVRGHLYSTNWLNTTGRKFCQVFSEKLAKRQVESGQNEVS
jgi:hypothetical protein